MYHKNIYAITKQCGGTPVSFASVLFNLEHNKKNRKCTSFRFTFQFIDFVVI